MTTERYMAVVKANEGRLFPLTLDAMNVGVLHAAVRLMLTHPEVKKMSPAFHTYAAKMREACLEFFADMGFSPEEIDYLDTTMD